AKNCGRAGTRTQKSSFKQLWGEDLRQYGKAQNERKARSLAAAIDLQCAPHGFDERAHDGQPQTRAGEAELNAFRREAIAKPFKDVVRNAGSGILHPELDPVS